MTYGITALTAFSPYGTSPATIRVRPRLTTCRIKDVVAEHFDIGREHMESPIRRRRIARPRQVAMYLTRELLGKTMPAIGSMFGGRDHTTVLHAIRQVPKMMGEDSDFAADVQMLRERLAG